METRSDFVDLVEDNTTENVLDLSDQDLKLKPEDIKFLCDYLTENTAITVLMLSDNANLSEALYSMLATISTIKDLHIDNNQLTPDSIRAIANMPLKSLNVRGTLSNELQIIAFTSFQNHRTLEKIDVSKSTIDLTTLGPTFASMPNLIELVINDSVLRKPDSFFKCFIKNINLAVILAENANLSNESIAYIAQIPRLFTLNISNNPLTDLTPLRYATNLKILTMNNLTNLQSDSLSQNLEALAHCPIFLLNLSSYSIQFAAEAFQPLKKFSRLTILEMTSCLIDDDTLIEISKIPNLLTLNLTNNPNITNQGLIALTNAPQLRRLNLSSTKVNDDSLRIISQLPLSNLNINNTAVTNEAFNVIQNSKLLLTLTVLGIKTNSLITKEGIAQFIENHNNPLLKLQGEKEEEEELNEEMEEEIEIPTEEKPVEQNERGGINENPQPSAPLHFQPIIPSGEYSPLLLIAIGRALIDKFNSLYNISFKHITFTDRLPLQVGKFYLAISWGSDVSLSKEVIEDLLILQQIEKNYQNENYQVTILDTNILQLAKSGMEPSPIDEEVLKEIAILFKPTYCRFRNEESYVQDLGFLTEVLTRIKLDTPTIPNSPKTDRKSPIITADGIDDSLAEYRNKIRVTVAAFKVRIYENASVFYPASYDDKAPLEDKLLAELLNTDSADIRMKQQAKFFKGILEFSIKQLADKDYKKFLLLLDFAKSLTDLSFKEGIITKEKFINLASQFHKQGEKRKELPSSF